MGESSVEQEQGVSATEVTGTPSPFPAVAAAKTLETLEFPAALEIVAAHAVSQLGAEADAVPAQLNLAVIDICHIA